MRGKSVAYVCSPFSGDTARNKQYARELTACVIDMNMLPITPHLYITECLDDTKTAEREIGLNVAIELLIHSDILFLGRKYGISSGMQGELNIAKEYGIPIIEKGIGGTD